MQRDEGRGSIDRSGSHVDCVPMSLTLDGMMEIVVLAEEMEGREGFSNHFLLGQL